MIMKSIIEGMELFDFFAAAAINKTIIFSLWEWEKRDWFVWFAALLPQAAYKSMKDELI